MQSSILIQPVAATVAPSVNTQFEVDRCPMVIGIVGSASIGVGDLFIIHRVDVQGNVRSTAANVVALNSNDSQVSQVGGSANPVAAVISVPGVYQIEKQGTALLGLEIYPVLFR